MSVASLEVLVVAVDNVDASGELVRGVVDVMYKLIFLVHIALGRAVASIMLDQRLILEASCRPAQWEGRLLLLASSSASTLLSR